MDHPPRPGTPYTAGRAQRQRLARTVAVVGTIAWLWWFVVATAPRAEAAVADAPVVAPTSTTTAALAPGQSAWLALGWTSDRTVTDWSTTVSAPDGVGVTYPTTRGGRDTSLFASSTLVGGTKDVVAFRVSVPYTQTRSFTLTVTSTYRWTPGATQDPKDSPTDHDNGRGNDREADRANSAEDHGAGRGNDDGGEDDAPEPAVGPTTSVTPSPSRAPAAVATAPATAAPVATATPTPTPKPTATPTPTPTATATSSPESTTRGNGPSRASERRPADRPAETGRTYTTTVQITVPVQASSDPAVTLGTAEVVVPAGSSTFQHLTLTGGPGDLADVAVSLGTLPPGLAVAYPGDRSAAGLNDGSTLVARSTDVAAVRLDTTALPRGTYTLPVVVRYRTTTAQTWTGTVTLRVS